ncbi:MAG: folate family ECF transporter S component [Clostridia bacterium]|nr:folate family ECF transporter S component [Clostridia bacterium]
MKQKFTTRKICLLGVFASITAILAIFATFRIGNQIKIPLKFIPVFMTGAIFGPISAGIVAAIGDILNAVLVPVGPIMPQITAVEFLYGVIWGACFYKAKENTFYYLRSAICALLQFVISITLMSWILTGIGYFSSFSAAVVIRMPASLATFILHMAVCTIGRRLIFRLKKFITKENF